MRLYVGIFQQESAIARFDRLFTPNHKSSKHMHIALVQTSIFLSENFILVMIDRTASGLTQVTNAFSDSLSLRLHNFNLAT